MKIALPLKYLSNFWTSLKMSLINCKIYLELNWSKDCVMPNVAGVTECKVTNTKLYVPIVTLSSKDNVKLVKLLEEGFNRLVYWNEYQKNRIQKFRQTFFCKISSWCLWCFFQRLRRLFVLAFDNTTDNDNNAFNDTVFKSNHRKYFLPKVNITNTTY